jgi:heme/copper-type cytochrome/quinol oxidase subunit 2
MAEALFMGWIWSNWRILSSVAIVLFLIYATVKYNDSFDSNPEVSPQEALKTKILLWVWFIGLTFSISLVISYFY